MGITWRMSRDERGDTFEGAKDLRDFSRGMQEIIPDLYLGGRQDAEEIDEGFALVVNCTPDIPQIERKGVEKVRMPIPDGHGEEENSAMAEYLPRVVEVIIETLRGGMGKCWSTVRRGDHDRRL